MSLLRRLFPRRSLHGLQAASHVRLHGVIAEGSALASPVTDRRAPVIAWYLSRRYTQRSGGSMVSGRGVDSDAYGPPIARGLRVAEWVMVEVDGRGVRVNTEGLEVQLASSEWDGQILNALPPELAHLRVNTNDPNLRYGERWLDVGDTVVLRAEVAPVAEVSAPYRGSGVLAPRADWETRGRATLIDTIGQQLRVVASA